MGDQRQGRTEPLAEKRTREKPERMRGRCLAATVVLEQESAAHCSTTRTELIATPSRKMRSTCMPAGRSPRSMSTSRKPLPW